jgi:D-sedoheptulose 7-phosphate isomerase
MLDTTINSYLYWKEFDSALDKLRGEFDKTKDVVKILLNARLHGRNIFVIGNGGSAATAIHFASDLNKGAKHPLATSGFKARALTENISDLTAIANDTDYDSVFLDQLINCASWGDVLIAISCSGNSRNVINAVKWFEGKNTKSISLTGFDGGELSNITDININVDSENVRVCEDLHLMLCHMISYELSKIPDFCIMLDRDGTICPDKHYLSDPDELELFNSVGQLSKLSDMGIPLFITTNQSGINRGLFSEDILEQIHGKLYKMLWKEGVEIQDMLYCPHTPEEECVCRKPAPAMAFHITDKWFFDLRKSFVMGDSDMDEGFARLIGAKFIKVENGDLKPACDKIIDIVSGRIQW